MSETQVNCSGLNSIADIAEKVGYARAIIDVMDELKRAGWNEAVITIALFARAKGIGKS